MADEKTTPAEPLDEMPAEPSVAQAPADAAAAETPQEPLADSHVAPVSLPELTPKARAEAGKHFGLLLDVGVELSAVVGLRELTLEQLLAISTGTVIDLERKAGDPVELHVNGRSIARAEIVVVDGRLGARVVELDDSPPVPAPSPDGTDAP